MTLRSSQTDISARGLAAHVLGRILGRSQPLDEALKAAPGASELSAPDLAFARLLIATTLRRLGQIDAVIAGCLERPLPDKALGARNALRLGVAQLLFLDTPPHAAVAESVGLVRERPFRGLANAVLRRVAREGRSLIEGQDAARLNTPDWLWDSWAAAYGEPTARMIAEAHLIEPPLDIVLKDPAEAELWTTPLEATPIGNGVLRRYAGGRIEDLPGFADGVWWIQDFAATLPAGLVPLSEGETIADLCAAPGGKTAQLAARGAHVIAVDRSDGRLKRVRNTLARLHLTAETVVADAADWRPGKPFSKILLDAPCSATGTIRRHPDLPHIKGPEDIQTVIAAQDRLLANAAHLLAPGGVMIYCVCSLEPAEGEERIAALLGTDASVKRLPIRPDEIPFLPEAITAQGDLRTLPCYLSGQGGLDGFFAARLEKQG